MPKPAERETPPSLSGSMDRTRPIRTAVLRAKAALNLPVDGDVSLIPYPKARSLTEQIDEVLRGIGASAQPQLPLPRVVRNLQAWLATLPEGAPALIPSFFTEIR